MFKKVVNSALNSKFIKRSKTIFLGTVSAQAIAFVTSFIITYYFQPEDLGLLGTLTAIVSIISGTLSFRSELAVINSSRKDSPNIFFQFSIFSAFSSTLFCISCFFLPWDFAKKVTSYFTPLLLWTWAYFLFFNSKQLPFQFNELKTSVWGSISRNTFTLFYQLLGGIINPSFTWLLSGRILGDYVGAIVQLRKYWKLIDFKKSTSNWISFFKSHSEHFIYMTPHHLCISLSSNIVIIFIEQNFGLISAGFFALAQRLIQAPLEMIGSILYNLTFQRFSELKKSPKDLRSFYTKILLLSFFLMVLTGSLIYSTADFLIPLLGSKWKGTSDMVKNLIPLFMTTLLATPTIYFFRIIGKSNIQLGLEIFELVFKIFLLVSVKFNTPLEMVLYLGLLTFGLSIGKSMLAYFFISQKIKASL
jgi:O-antigen/teichoic acid export membrane protein